MHRVRLSVVLLLGLLAAVGQFQPLSGQAPARSGFFIGFGFGVGALGVEDVDERETSAVGYFKIGGAVSDQVLIGAESTAWVKDESGVTLSSTALNAVAYVYPNPTGGFYLKGGLGIATLEVDVGAFGSGSETGTALTLGVGYDIGFGGRFGLTPYGGLVIGNYEGGSTNVLEFGLGVNWY